MRSSDVENLWHMVYPEAPYAVLQDLAKDKFIDALFDLELHLNLSESRLTSILAATQVVHKIESYRVADQADRSAGVPKVQSENHRTSPRRSPK